MYEFIYKINPKLEDRYSEILIGAGVSSFYFEKTANSSLLKIYSDSSDPIREINPDLLIDVLEIYESDWKNKWAEDYRGQELTDNFYVLPPEIPKPQKEYKFTILIDPEDSFGDGHHPTTRLCSSLMEQVIMMEKLNKEISFLDIGTGSGILAIQAVFFGIKDIELFDTDECSVEKANKNLYLNGVDGVRAFRNDLYTYNSSKKYDIIVANLLSRIIEDNIEKLKSLLNTDGMLILSGISSRWEKEMMRLFKNSGLQIFLHKKLEEWEGFVLKLNV